MPEPQQFKKAFVLAKETAYRQTWHTIGNAQHMPKLFVYTDATTNTPQKPHRARSVYGMASYLSTIVTHCGLPQIVSSTSLQSSPGPFLNKALLSLTMGCAQGSQAGCYDCTEQLETPREALMLWNSCLGPYLLDQS